MDLRQRLKLVKVHMILIICYLDSQKEVVVFLNGGIQKMRTFEPQLEVKLLVPVTAEEAFQ